ncbi:Por secretion system C-terminal sorting domain-containing protein [Chitinophaga jiangningensis]|uniref:Por secretion system C-terminal sorting domain-containing protein n=2 Tax=Chitinophaga jiangningensis TaxID=1419482 RepID=A0A1M7JZH6_9BACT|nr:Por secretion system C-terminal sorting domain-containing protein [Chitinophaga jiangningensis]
MKSSLSSVCKALLSLCLCTGMLSPTTHAQTNLLPFGSTWKYLDNGTNQGTAWRAPAFSDAAWASGPAQLGYGDGDEATVVSYGSSSSAKYITTYFRKTFNVTGAAAYTGFTLEYKRDDGLVIYINGTEVVRNNLPTGTISYTTLASNASDGGATVFTASVAAGLITEGNNTIAVEVHQTSATSSDLSFDLQFKGNTASTIPQVIRGPYLQMGNQSAVTLRWRTDIATTGKVKYGLSATALNDSVVHTTSLTEHELRVSGLQPDTKYYYSIGNSTNVLQAGADNYFVTAPPATTTRKIRIAAYGDCGTASSVQTNVRNAYLSYMGTNHTDVWLLLGDNAYNGGYDTEYQSNFFEMYKNDLLKNVLLFPTLGNHDYDNSSTLQTSHNIPYLSNFTLPSAGECGGLASGKEEYYSFDYGDVHFVCLDSYGLESGKRFFDTTSTQVQWLKNDLAANTRKWVIAYWHHPPYTMGSHNSDTNSDLTNIRQNLIRILERYGVDLILNGHSHDYERSYLMKGHYGLENTFSMTTHAVSSSSAKYDGTSNSCPYFSTATKGNHGTVYVVAGSAGQVGGTQSSFPHASSYYANATNGGSLVVEVEGNRLDAKWVAADNTIKDKFTILKDVNKNRVINATAAQPLVLSAYWPGTYAWSTGASTSSVTITPAVGTTVYTVADNSVAASQCVKDTFTVVAAPALVATLGKPQTTVLPFDLDVFPNPSTNGRIQVEIRNDKPQQLEILIADVNGKVVHAERRTVPQGATRKEYQLEKGVYFITAVTSSKEKFTKKIVVQ